MILRSSATARLDQILKQMRYGERKSREKRERDMEKWEERESYG